jgi:hypothetical protein
MLRLHPDFVGEFAPGSVSTLPSTGIAEMVFMEKDRGKNQGRTVVVFGIGGLVTVAIVVAGSVAMIAWLTGVMTLR